MQDSVGCQQDLPIGLHESASCMHDLDRNLQLLSRDLHKSPSNIQDSSSGLQKQQRGLWCIQDPKSRLDEKILQQEHAMHYSIQKPLICYTP